MDNDKSNLHGIKLSDAAKLRKNGLMTGKIRELESKIKNIEDSDYLDAFVYSHNGSEMCSLVLLLHRDDNSFSGELRIKLSALLSGDMTIREYRRIIEESIDWAFRQGFYKISIILKSDEIDKEEVLRDNKFVQEAILHEEFDFESSYAEAGLFYLIEPHYRKYNCCFVPFQKGVYVLYGGRDYVDKGRIYSYGDLIEDTIAARMGKYLGIVDINNHLLPKGVEEYQFDEDFLERILPHEVFKGYSELKGYFQKERTTFDLEIKFQTKSDFRLNVWNEIRKISYASTLCYEDIAMALCDNDIAKAKTLVRVIGQACADSPVPIIIPCHRVIGKDGRLVGYKEGVEFKDFLLIHESFSAIMI